FNALFGGVRRARDRYMLDYWGLSFKQASKALLAELAERHETKPANRRWKIAVCGPHRSPQVELGPDFETTWEPMGADFAMMLGEFYCATLDAPILIEIVRDGVTYARVYDIRGRSIPTLLTRPALRARPPPPAADRRLVDGPALGAALSVAEGWDYRSLTPRPR